MDKTFRQTQPLDRWIGHVHGMIETVFGQVQGHRPNPADHVDEGIWSNNHRTEAARLMRVNHAGEVAAQALYQGQALTAQESQTKDQLIEAAEEENDHLQWCRERLEELNSHVSYLGPLWYLGSLTIGMVAGLLGDKWSLGFVAETEKQVVKHLESHLERLTQEDSKSRAIVSVMREDEMRHGHVASNSGGEPLPLPVQTMMMMMSRVMTSTAYWI